MKTSKAICKLRKR